ncbi:MAG: TIGR04086 family membrane protein [Oscillospiraceae bacterium]|nr:TIGR04086 family membrane protein [Oscillospiraceae bacterium]
MRKTKEKQTAPLGFAANAGIGAGVALGLSLVLLLIASVFVASGRVPQGAMGLLTVGVLFVSSLVGAFVAIRRNRSRALFVGLAEGAILYAITFTGGVFAEVGLFGGLSIFLLTAALLGGVTAGLLSTRPKRRKL